VNGRSVTAYRDTGSDKCFADKCFANSQLFPEVPRTGKIEIFGINDKDPVTVPSGHMKVKSPMFGTEKAIIVEVGFLDINNLEFLIGNDIFDQQNVIDVVQTHETSSTALTNAELNEVMNLPSASVQFPNNDNAHVRSRESTPQKSNTDGDVTVRWTRERSCCVTQCNFRAHPTVLLIAVLTRTDALMTDSKTEGAAYSGPARPAAAVGTADTVMQVSKSDATNGTLITLPTAGNRSPGTADEVIIDDCLVKQTNLMHGMTVDTQAEFARLCRVYGKVSATTNGRMRAEGQELAQKPKQTHETDKTFAPLRGMFGQDENNDSKSAGHIAETRSDMEQQRI